MRTSRKTAATEPRPFGHSIAPGLQREPRWYACYTRAHHEKQVDRMLQQRNVESYLPLLERRRQWHDRQKVIQVPMFPGYVFARFAQDTLSPVLSIPGVVSVVRANGVVAPISDEEVANIRRLVQALSREELEPELKPVLNTGQLVRVAAGPFEGIEGRVVESRGRSRVLVGLTALAQGVELDIASELLEAMPEPPMA